MSQLERVALALASTRTWFSPRDAPSMPTNDSDPLHRVRLVAYSWRYLAHNSAPNSMRATQTLAPLRNVQLATMRPCPNCSAHHTHELDPVTRKLVPVVSWIF